MGTMGTGRIWLGTAVLVCTLAVFVSALAGWHTAQARLQASNDPSRLQPVEASAQGEAHAVESWRGDPRWLRSGDARR